jgi:hypothetical protein
MVDREVDVAHRAHARLGAELARDVAQLDGRDRVGRAHGIGRPDLRDPVRGPAGAGRARRSWPAGGEGRVARADDDQVPGGAGRRASAHLGEALGREAGIDRHEVDPVAVPDLHA